MSSYKVYGVAISTLLFHSNNWLKMSAFSVDTEPTDNAFTRHGVFDNKLLLQTMTHLLRQ